MLRVLFRHGDGSATNENLRVAQKSCAQANPSVVKRRQLLLASQPALWLLATEPASAAAWRGFQGPWSSFVPMQPEPVRVPRKRLALQFAVLLMRSTYEAVDSLDFIAMNNFQVKFWKLRQAEFEPYKLLYDPVAVPVGDLTSPVYFDFISFCQFQTISLQIPDAPLVFEEFCEECDGEALQRPMRVVTRAPALADNAQLPALLQARTGDAIYAGLANGFQGVVFDAPGPCRPGASLAELAASAQKLLDVFVKNGYAINARVSDVRETAPGRGTWRVSVDGPANLWGISSLQARNALVFNAMDALAMQGWLRASQMQSTFTFSVQDQSVVQEWSIERAQGGQL